MGHECFFVFANMGHMGVKISNGIASESKQQICSPKSMYTARAGGPVSSLFKEL